MDVSALVVCLMLLCLGGFSTPFPQESQAPNTATMPSIAANSSFPCVTARGVQGSCVDRQYCDYSTNAIDLTLFAPKGYKKPCSERDACCPFNSQIQPKIDESEQMIPLREDNQPLADDDK